MLKSNLYPYAIKAFYTVGETYKIRKVLLQLAIFLGCNIQIKNGHHETTRLEIINISIINVLIVKTSVLIFLIKKNLDSDLVWLMQ